VPIRRRDPAIPEQVAAVVDRAIADDVSERYPDAGALRAALRKALAAATRP
jgi:hypothetical protein